MPTTHCVVSGSFGVDGAYNDSPVKLFSDFEQVWEIEYDGSAKDFRRQFSHHKRITAHTIWEQGIKPACKQTQIPITADFSSQEDFVASSFWPSAGDIVCEYRYLSLIKEFPMGGDVLA